MTNDQYVKHSLRLLAIAFTITFVFAQAFTPVFALKAVDSSEYEQFVDTPVNSAQGNWTNVQKPLFPVFINDSQIAIGGNWSIVEPLEAGNCYHVYLYGDWVNTNAFPKTDYNIYVYNPQGILESEHTESAGLPEFLGNMGNGTFFIPSNTGNYTFVISNSPGTSKGTQPATFMAIENIATNKWNEQYIEGRKAGAPSSYFTSWAYEFVSDSPKIQVWINVPNTLDMYEARLYAMSNTQSLLLNNAPLPWEPGLNGNVSGNVGGYNTDANKYRGVAYASCGNKGEDMFLEYSTTSTEKTLYHLVLIGESGSGNLSFLVKSDFNIAALTPLTPPGRIYPWNQTRVIYASNSSNLENAVLKYSIDNWNNTQEVQMDITNKSATFTFPPQKAGTLVQYRILAKDALLNSLSAEGDFTVKQPSMLNITTLKDIHRVGENITVKGLLTGQQSSAPITLQFMTSKETYTVEAITSINGTFTASFSTNSSGIGTIMASFAGDKSVYSSDSEPIMVEVDEPLFYVKNGPFIGGGFLGAIGIISAVFYIRKRRQ